VAQICTKLPQTHWGSSERSPNPLAGKGRGKEGKGGERKGREGKRGEFALNLSLDIPYAFGLRVMFVNVRGAGLC